MHFGGRRACCHYLQFSEQPMPNHAPADGSGPAGLLIDSVPDDAIWILDSGFWNGQGCQGPSRGSATGTLLIP